MTLYESVRAVTGASGDGPIDWTAVTDAARSATDPGDIELTDRERAGYASDVRDGRDRIREVADVDFELPDTVQVLNRHHWLDANAETFRRVMRPLADRVETVPPVGRVVNTGSMAVALAVLSNNVLGQYDPLLLAEANGVDDHALYFVHPNIVAVADELAVEVSRFRRWIAVHELAHAAEFAAAPWLTDHMEAKLTEAVESLTDADFESVPLGELDTTMTAVEGYAELVMDRAFDGEFADLRRKLDQRRRGGGLVAKLLRRLLGLDVKRRQYERGKAFFDAVADARGVGGASAVWDRPENLPTDDELARPGLWLQRVEP